MHGNATLYLTSRIVHFMHAKCDFSVLTVTLLHHFFAVDSEFSLVQVLFMIMLEMGKKYLIYRDWTLFVIVYFIEILTIVEHRSLFMKISVFPKSIDHEL